MKRIVRVLKELKKWHKVEEIGVIWDFCSLWQKGADKDHLDCLHYLCVIDKFSKEIDAADELFENKCQRRNSTVYNNTTYTSLSVLNLEVAFVGDR